MFEVAVVAATTRFVWSCMHITRISRGTQKGCGQFPIIQIGRSYDEVAADLRRHYETTGERGLDEANDRFKPLARFFHGRRVVNVDGTLASVYVQQRQKSGVANGTINRELAMLIRMLRLAHE